MKIDESEFFKEATLRICSSLNIEQALWQCFIYIRDFIPGNQIFFDVYRYETNTLQGIAAADEKRGILTSYQFQLSGEAREVIETKWIEKRTRIIPRLGDHVVTAGLINSTYYPNGSAIVMDLMLEGEELGVLSILNDSNEAYTQEHVRLLSLLNKPFAIALTNGLRFRELTKIKERLVDDKQYLQTELNEMGGKTVVGADFGLKKMMMMVRQVARLDSPVLLQGETGVGKELIANAVHNLSPRRSGPLIKVNCGAIPESLLDSELFGHEKGAFTGAVSRKRGRFERADGGTIFLDEIGELAPEAQVRILRVLQEKEIERVGGSESVKVNIRIIAATHRNLEAMVETGEFREDLIYRLKVFPIEIPPLRERMDDIPALVQHIVRKKAKEMKLNALPSLAPGAMGHLMEYPWPGNVRELENVVERALILSMGQPLVFSELRAVTAPTETTAADDLEAATSLNLDHQMATHIRQVLAKSAGKVGGKGGAAELLGLHPMTLRHRMKKLGIPFGRSRKS